MKQKTRLCVFLLVASLLLQGCGTILHPERRNQPAGQIDAGIAILDALWLFGGILPGVIAFAVDFSTGAIYLPPRSLPQPLPQPPPQPQPAPRSPSGP